MKPLWPSHYTPPHICCSNASEVIGYVARRFKVTRGELLGRQRKIWLVYARSAVVAILLRRGNSTTTVGRILRRDHTTILNARDRLPEYMAKCDLIADVVESAA